MQATKRMLMFAAACALVCAHAPARVEPVSTAFTYQGQLKEVGVPVTDTADFQFSLWTDPESGDQSGATISLANVNIVNGLFTVSLDFGADALDGEARWLEILARRPAWDGGGDEPPFTTLYPRHPLTAVPYAQHTRGVYVDGAGNVGLGTTSPAAKLDVVGNVVASGDSTGHGGLDVMVPAGSTIMWSGEIDGDGYPVVDGAANPRWHICDGTEGTEDLRDRFVVGAGAAYTTGDTGGAAAVTLSTTQIPSHRHSFSGETYTAGAHTHEYTDKCWDDESAVLALFEGQTGLQNREYSYQRDSGSAGSHSHSFSGSTNNAGGGGAHENRPPYYSLTFIKHIGQGQPMQATGSVLSTTASASTSTHPTAQAEPVSTAFTYQGQLREAGVQVTDTADFTFSLWSDPDSVDPEEQVGDTIVLGGVDVVNGLFTVPVDFGAGALDGEARWLEIAARRPAWDGGGGEPPFTPLSPRQALTGVPYARQTRGLHIDDTGNVGIGTTSPAAKLDVVGDISTSGDSTGRGGLAVMVPAGAIIMWSGTIVAGHPEVDGAADPRWHLCDGNLGTPDLQNRFVVGAGASYTTGDTGGESLMILTVAHVPRHAHSLSADTPAAGAHGHGYTDCSFNWNWTIKCDGGLSKIASDEWPANESKRTASAGSHSHSYNGNTVSAGGGVAHENRPPYYALAFIMYVGEGRQMQATGSVTSARATAVASTHATARAEPIPAAFTYQGQLEEAGVPVTEIVNFEFSLWSDPESVDPGDQVGAVIHIENIDVVNGLFTVPLDFGVDAFNGEDRWLEIGACFPAWDDCDGIPPFPRMSPRRPLTAAPHALQTLGLHVDDVGNVSIGNTSPTAKLDVAGDITVSGNSTGRDGLAVMVPQGSIIMWDGEIDGDGSPVVDGVSDTRWHLCDGDAGTPDLRDRFLVGTGDTYITGDTGGASQVTLAVQDLGPHDHVFSGGTSTVGDHDHSYEDRYWRNTVLVFAMGADLVIDNAYRTRTDTTSSAGNHSHPISGDTGSTGGGGAHENRPPYYAMTFIMHVGE